MIDLKSLNNRLGFRRMLHEISLIPLFVFRSILRYNFSVIYFNGTIQIYDGSSPTVQLLLSRDYVHYVDSNELWVPWRTFGQLAYCYEHIVLLQYSLKMNAIVPLRDARKTDFRILTWNFPWRYSLMRIVYCECFRFFLFASILKWEHQICQFI